MDALNPDFLILKYHKLIIYSLKIQILILVCGLLIKKRFKLNSNKNVCLQYLDDDNNPTNKYPCNPNNSDYACAGLISDNKRHLTIMPHPERSFLKYQIPYSNIPLKTHYSPWFSLFVNIKNNI